MKLEKTVIVYEVKQVSHRHYFINDMVCVEECTIDINYHELENQKKTFHEI